MIIRSLTPAREPGALVHPSQQEALCAPTPTYVTEGRSQVIAIGKKLREIRTSKNLSQGDIEERTGLFRCYISRVEHGHTVPSVKTLQKMALALEVPMYLLFHDRNGPDEKPSLSLGENGHDKGNLCGGLTHERDEFHQFAKALSQMTDRQRSLLIATAPLMAK